MINKIKEKFLENEKWIIVLLLAVCSFFFFFQLGSYKLIDVDEPRYAEAARELLEKGDWITPYFNYELRFDKPIFHYWLIALSYLVFGISEFAARFPSAILATGLVFLTYYFGRTTISKSFGVIAALILATNLEFLALSRMSITDMTLSAFIASAIMTGFLGAFKEGSSKKYWWWFAYLFCGLAVLTKGPVGLAIPVIVVGLYLLLTGKIKESLRPQYILPGIAIFLLTVIPWYYAIIKIHGSTFVDYFFIKHNFKRFATKDLGHIQPFYFYFIVVFAGFFPWITYLITSFLKNGSDIWQVIKAKKAELSLTKFDIFKDADNKTKVMLFTSIWFLFIFVFFSSSSAKLLTYILPLFPALALLTARIWDEYLVEGKHKKAITNATICFCILCVILCIVQMFAFNTILPREVRVDSMFIDYSLILTLTGLPLSILLLVKESNKIKAFGSIIILMAFMVTIAVQNIMPVVYKSGQRDLITYVNLSKAFNEPHQFVTHGLTKPSLVFYSRQKVKNIDDKELETLLKDKTTALIVIKDKRIKELPKNLKFYVINHGTRYSLISNKNLISSKEECYYESMSGK